MMMSQGAAPNLTDIPFEVLESHVASHLRTKDINSLWNATKCIQTEATVKGAYNKMLKDKYFVYSAADMFHAFERLHKGVSFPNVQFELFLKNLNKLDYDTIMSFIKNLNVSQLKGSVKEILTKINSGMAVPRKSVLIVYTIINHFRFRYEIRKNKIWRETIVEQANEFLKDIEKPEVLAKVHSDVIQHLKMLLSEADRFYSNV